MTQKSRVAAPTAMYRLSERLFRPTLDRRSLSEHAPIVLVASREKDSYALVHGLVATAIAAEQNAKVVAFRFRDRLYRPSLRRVRAGLEDAALRRSDYGAFADQEVVIGPTLWELLRVKFAIRRYAADKPTRHDLVHFTIEGVRIGDLAFDAFVTRGRAVAVDPVDVRLLRELTKFSVRALALRRYLRRNHCCAVIVKDLAYAVGVPGRVALSLGIDAFASSVEWCNRLSVERPDKELDYLDYGSELEKLSATDRALARALGAEFLEQRLAPGSGGFTVTGVDVWGDDDTGKVPVLPRPAVATILVAPHSFTDAQHAGGDAIFSDAYSWLEFIHEVVETTNYHWYIKLHPDQRDTETDVREAIGRLFADRDDVHVLDGAVTHGALRRHGIDLALTIYGTIALEYPAVGIPALTTRPLNPHALFAYALHPKSADEYRSILLDPEQWSYDIPMSEVAEFAYLHYLVEGSVFSEVGPHDVREVDDLGEGESPLFRAWEALDDDRLNRILWLYRDWIRSGSYSLNRFAALRDGGHRRLLDDYRRARAAGQTGRLQIRLP